MLQLSFKDVFTTFCRKICNSWVQFGSEHNPLVWTNQRKFHKQEYYSVHKFQQMWNMCKFSFFLSCGFLVYVLLYIVFIKSFRLRKTVVLLCDLYFKASGIVTLFPALVTKFLRGMVSKRLSGFQVKTPRKILICYSNRLMRNVLCEVPRKCIVWSTSSVPWNYWNSFSSFVIVKNLQK